MRPHIAGFGDLLIQSPICPPDCCLANTSTCRAQAHVQPLGSCPCALAVGAAEGIRFLGYICRGALQCTPGFNGSEGVWGRPHSCCKSFSCKTQVQFLVPLCWSTDNMGSEPGCGQGA